MDENCNGNPPSVIVTGNDLDPGGNGMAASDPAAGLNGINLPTTVNIYFLSNKLLKYVSFWVLKTKIFAQKWLLCCLNSTADSSSKIGHAFRKYCLSKIAVIKK